MQGQIMFKRVLAASTIAALLAACGQGGFQRGVFYGKVIDKTPEEVVSSFGKPDAIDQAIPDSPRYIYSNKTFNSDDMNKVDEKTIVDFAKGKDGQLHVTEVSYR
jgi:hypothetical protein